MKITLQRWSEHFIRFCLVVCAILVCASARGPELKLPEASPLEFAPIQVRLDDKTAKLPPEEAFKKGIECVKGHFDLFDPKWQVTLRRSTTTNGWFMMITRFPKPGLKEDKIIIKDNGEVFDLPGL